MDVEGGELVKTVVICTW